MTETDIKNSWRPLDRIKDVKKELELLSLLIRDESEQVSWMHKLSPNVFFDDTNLTIFKLLMDMFVGKRAINKGSVASAINQQLHSFQISGAMNRLNDILNCVPTDTFEIISRDLFNTYKARILYREVFLVANKKFLENESVDKLIEDISQTIFSVEDPISKEQIADVALRTFENIFNPNPEDAGLEIGLAEFDNAYGGIKKDTYITVGAESGTGKTAYLVDLIYRLCSRHKDKIAICFFSMEMSQERIVRRLLSRMTNVNSMKFDQNRVKGITPEEKADLFESAKQIRNWPLEIVYESMDIHKVKMKARQFVMKNKGKHHIFLVDHIGKIESSGSDMRVNTIKNSQGLKSICIDHKSTVVVLSQLLKELSGDKYKPTYHRPNESHIMESGAIKADSDILFLLWRPGNRFDQIDYGGVEGWKTKNKMILINEKNRDGIEKTDMIFECNMGTSKLENTITPF